MKNYEYNSYNISNYFRRVSKILNIFSWYKRFTCNCTLMSSGIYLVSLVLVSMIKPCVLLGNPTHVDLCVYVNDETNKNVLCCIFLYLALMFVTRAIHK